MIAKEIVERAKEFSSKWYTMGSLPEFGTTEFWRAAGTSVAFTYHLASQNIKNYWSSRVTVEVENGLPTAAINLENGKIVLSSNFFNAEFYSNLIGEELEPEELSYFAIALINGCLTHESLHAKHSIRVGNLADFVKGSRATIPMIAKGFSLEQQISAFNLTEDLFIDSQVPNNLRDWLELRADMLFSEQDLMERAFQFTVSPSFGTWFNLLILYKNKSLRSNDVWEILLSEETLKVLKNASKMHGFSSVWDRLEVSRELLQTWKPEEQEQDEDGEQGEDGDSSSNSDSSSSSDSSSDEGDSTDYSNPTKGEQDAGEQFSQAANSTEEMGEDELNQVQSEIDESAEETGKKETGVEVFSTNKGEVCSWNELIESDVMDGTMTGFARAAAITESIDFKFVEELIAKRTLNRTPGAARTHGSVMVKSRLSRIATDGKIFAKMDAERKRNKRIEVIINIDVSGSTEIKGILGDLISTGLEMSKALRKARIAHSVYAHTAKRASGGLLSGEIHPALIHVFSYDMQETNTNQQERFEKLQFVQTHNNYDGVVVEALRSKYTGKDATLYLFNLSDGQPSSIDYMEPACIEHTKQEINQSRKEGINVISISVVRSVVGANDGIYGKAWNLDATGNIAGAFKNLIRNLV